MTEGLLSISCLDISVPLAENETMHIGYVLNENQELSELGKSYLEELRKYAPANP